MKPQAPGIQPKLPTAFPEYEHEPLDDIEWLQKTQLQSPLDAGFLHLKGDQDDYSSLHQHAG